MKTAELLDLARDRAGIPSNYRLARILEVSDQTMYCWKTGKKWPDDGMAVRLAELAQLDPGQVLAGLRAEREPDPVRSVWADVAARLARTAVAAAVAAVGVTGGPDAGASVPDQASQSAGGARLHLLSNSRQDGTAGSTRPSAAV